MVYEIEYKASVAKDLARLDRAGARRIVAKLERELGAGARTGMPLQGEFHGLWRIRVGDYRVIYVRTERGFLVLHVSHRREAYR
mgnify:CR=1 FL=1